MVKRTSTWTDRRADGYGGSHNASIICGYVRTIEIKTTELIFSGRTVLYGISEGRVYFMESQKCGIKNIAHVVIMMSLCITFSKRGKQMSAQCTEHTRSSWMISRASITEKREEGEKTIVTKT